MQTSMFNTPALFGDHHVTEVRRILFALPGVKDVYASSAFQVVQVEFDESQTTHEALAQKLEAAGYLGDIQVTSEQGKSVFRHTAIHETVKQTVTFAQHTPYRGRPLWNCPGIGVVGKMDE